MRVLRAYCRRIAYQKAPPAFTIMQNMLIARAGHAPRGPPVQPVEGLNTTRVWCTSNLLLAYPQRPSGNDNYILSDKETNTA